LVVCKAGERGRSINIYCPLEKRISSHLRSNRWKLNANN